jgi:hypothetical protein
MLGTFPCEPKNLDSYETNNKQGEVKGIEVW